MKNIEDIIIAHLHDEASADEVRRLFEWIRKEPENAREFARCALLHAQLRGQLCGEKRARESGEFATVAGTTPSAELESTGRHSHARASTKKKVRSRFSLPLAGLVAASVLVAVVFILLRHHEDGPVAQRPKTHEPFATIAQTVDATWGGQRDFGKGDRAVAETLDLRDGFVRLELDSGVQVTLQGPAQLELITPDRVELTSGLLTATVPPGAEGFRVDTPNAEVTDLGTAFGIHVDDNGVSSVSVFDGEVDVALRDSGNRRLLKEGEAARIGDGQAIETVEFDAAPFERLWPISSGIRGSTGAFRFAPPWPRRLRFVQSDDEIFVVPQGYVTTLAEPLKVNIASPGEYARAETLTASELPAGLVVRSYMLHFDPEHHGKRQHYERTTGSITFDRPVLGLVVLHEELAASASRFPGRKAGEFLEHRQLELTGTRVGDVITLSDDRRTVSLDLAAPGQFSDLVRVIVDAAKAE
jgi:FecR-like protein